LLDIPERLKQHSNLLGAMANPKRLRILLLLCQQEWNVGDLAKTIEITQAALSQHLAKLRAAGLVSTRRDRQVIYYDCRSDAVRDILCVLYGRAAGPHRSISNTNQ
jgi:DNA-binding transcriptional ArsR family regulator